MKLFGQVVKTQPGYGVISDWPYRGYIYNEYGQVIASEMGGMTEEKCREAVLYTAKRIQNHEFAQIRGMFEIPEEEPSSEKLEFVGDTKRIQVSAEHTRDVVANETRCSRTDPHRGHFWENVNAPYRTSHCSGNVVE